MYGRPNEAPSLLCERTVHEVLTKLSSYADRVTMAGPTPRFWCDADLNWPETVAYTADQALRRVATGHGIRFVPYLGRALTCMDQRRHVVKSTIAAHWSARDKVHLSVAGYNKVLKKLGTLFG